MSVTRTRYKGINGFLLDVSGGNDLWLGTESTFESLGQRRYIFIGALILIMSTISGFSAGFAVWETGYSLGFVSRCFLSIAFALVFGGIVFGLYRLYVCLFQGADTMFSIKLRWCSAVLPFFTFTLLGFVCSVPILVLFLTPKLASSDGETKFIRGFREQLYEVAFGAEKMRKPFFTAWLANEQREVRANLELPSFKCLDDLRSQLLAGRSLDRKLLPDVVLCEAVLNEFKLAAESGDLKKYEEYKEWGGDWSDTSLRPYYLANFEFLTDQLSRLRRSHGLITSFNEIFEVWPELCFTWFMLFLLLFNFPSMIALVMSRLPVYYYRREMWRAYLATKWGIFIDAFRVFDRNGNQHYIDVYSSPNNVLKDVLGHLTKIKGKNV